MLLKMNPKKYEPRGQMGDGISTARPGRRPVVSHGLLYIRGKDRLIAAELIPQTK